MQKSLSQIVYIHKKTLKDTMNTEVLIVGGGPIGLTLAAALSPLNLSITLIDAMDAQTMLTPAHDGRTIALSYGTYQFLKSLNLWTQDLILDSAEIESILVEDEDGALVHYEKSLTQGLPMGYNAHLATLRKTLFLYVQSLSNVKIIAPAHLESLSWRENCIEARLSSNQTIVAKVCLGADGRTSRCRKLAKIKTWEYPYDHTALVFNVQYAQPHKNQAVEKFLKRGPLALLPMPGMHSSVIWSEKTAAAHHMKSLSSQEFKTELNSRFGDRFGNLELTTPIWSYPLSLSVVSQYYAPRLALIGDAAHVIHPVAGQGLNLGFRDVITIVEELKEFLALGLDYSSPLLMERYQKKRRADILGLTAATHGLLKFFSSSRPSMKILRKLGLNYLENSLSLKSIFTQHAMGNASYQQKPIKQVASPLEAKK